MSDADSLEIARQFAARQNATISDPIEQDRSYRFDAHGTDRHGRNWDISATGPSEAEALTSLCRALQLTHWDYCADRFDNNCEVLAQALFLAFPNVEMMTEADDDDDANMQFFMHDLETDREFRLAATKRRILELPRRVRPTFIPKNVLLHLQRIGIIEQLKNSGDAQMR